MFCPNCGSKNDDSAARCAQCGFELQSVKPAPRFKGTMVMQAPAIPATQGPGAASPAQAGGQQAPARGGSPLKGTMVGVAPPGMEDLRKQIAESRAAAGTPQASPAQGPFGAPTAAATPNARLKGTMIGLAPPGPGEDPGQETMLGVAPEASRGAAPPAQAPVPSTFPPPAASAQMSRPMPSQLKGTVVGAAVDPAAFGISGAARAPTTTASPTAESQKADAFGGTLLAGAGPAAQFGATQPVPPMNPQPSELGGPAWNNATPGHAPHAGATGRQQPVARNASATPPAKSNLAVVVLIAVVVVLAIALVGIGVMLRNRSAAQNVPPTTDAPAAK